MNAIALRIVVAQRYSMQAAYCIVQMLPHAATYRLQQAVFKFNAVGNWEPVQNIKEKHHIQSLSQPPNPHMCTNKQPFYTHVHLHILQKFMCLLNSGTRAESAIHLHGNGSSAEVENPGKLDRR